MALSLARRGPAASLPDGPPLFIDRVLCDAHGMCAELLPELISLDDWGYPIMRPGPVPASLLGHARRAIDACPVLALRLAANARGTPPGKG